MSRCPPATDRSTPEGIGVGAHTYSLPGAKSTEFNLQEERVVLKTPMDAPGLFLVWMHCKTVDPVWV